MNSADTPCDSSAEVPLRLLVVNPNGRDQPVSYHDGIIMHRAGEHPPINYHAFAAATCGTLVDSVDLLVHSRPHVALVLIRRRMRASLRAVRALRAAGWVVLVTWKEAGRFQIARQLRAPLRKRLYTRVIAEANAVISCTCDGPPLPAGQTSLTIPTPYPVDLPDWNFQVPLSDRAGIFIGTRQFNVQSRQHAIAAHRAGTLAADVGCRVTILNTEGSRGRRRIDAIAGRHVDVIDGTRPYQEYMQLMARHRIVLQCDQSGVPGQVAGDALLCRSLCIGGDGLIETLTFPEYAGEIADTQMDAARRLLIDDTFYDDEVRASQRRALAQVSFGAVRSRLRQVVAELAQGGVECTSDVGLSAG